MGKSLIVNADDYDRATGVVEVILQVHQQGIVTSMMAMMNSSNTRTRYAMPKATAGGRRLEPLRPLRGADGAEGMVSSAGSVDFSALSGSRTWTVIVTVQEDEQCHQS